MKRRLTGVVLALLLATAGTFILVAYVQSARDQAVAGERLVDVILVRKPIAKGSPAATGSVTTAQVPAKVRAKGAVSDLDRLDGLVAAVDLVPGEQLVVSRFVKPEIVRQGDAPLDKLQVTVSLEPQRAVGGRIRPGDTVGVMVSFKGVNEQPFGGIAQPSRTLLALRKVRVVAVQTEQAPPKKDDKKAEADDGATVAPTGKLLVTLAVDASSAQRLVFAAEEGTLWLVAEPSGVPDAGTEVVTRASVLS
jgi:pilus assembly protein CpaB